MSKSNVTLLDERDCEVIMAALGELPAKTSMATIMKLQGQFGNQPAILEAVLKSPEAEEILGKKDAPKSGL